MKSLLCMYIKRRCGLTVRVATVLLLVVTADAVHAQPAQTREQPLRQAVSATVGAGFPLSHEGITAYWQPGLSASMRFTTSVTRYVGIGVGVDASQFSFDGAAFEAEYPSVVPEAHDLLQVGVSLHAKILLLPSYRTCPYIALELGASRLTEATYRKVIAGARVTYYNVGGSTRLMAGVAGGVDIVLSRWLAVELEAKASYIHNDPDAGILAAGRAGFRVRF
jgi:hypothetical protein